MSQFVISPLLQSRSRQEDPEQLRLKQKAKEVSVKRFEERGLGAEGGAMMATSHRPLTNDSVSMLVSTDAAAGTGSDQAEGSQPDGPGRHRPPQETENGLTGSGFQCRGTE